MKTALVMGIQASGISAAALLKREGYEVRLYDDRQETENNWRDRGEEIFAGLDLVVISPSIPGTHPVVKEALARGIRVESEMEFGSKFLTGTKIVVTGTNGKTTTVDSSTKCSK